MEQGYINLPAREKSILWVLLFAGPVLWFIQLEANFALVPIACNTHNLLPIYLSSALFLVLCLAALGISLRFSLKYAHSDAELPRFMAYLSALVSALFALVIAAQAIPTFFFSPCQ